MRVANLPTNPEPTLPEFTNQERKAPTIAWYRTPIPPAELKALHRRSDARGFAQTLGFLAVLGGAFAFAVYSWARLPWWSTVAAVFLYGTINNFMINAMHELGHGTVFKTRWLNWFFLPVFAFLGWQNFEWFEQSHTRHHRYTQHPPDDLETVSSTRLAVVHFFKQGFVNLAGVSWALGNAWRMARGEFRGEWEMTVYPAHRPENRRATVRWARILLVGHALVAVVSLSLGWWIVPVLVSGGQFVGGWLFFLCNNTQHIGLPDTVPDFRLCCRTFRVNPVVQFLYWHMNFHTEHHMYAAVPCYRLGRLHALIRHDLPPCADGLAAVWNEIAVTQARHAADPAYRYHDLVPGIPAGAS